MGRHVPMPATGAWPLVVEQIEVLPEEMYYVCVRFNGVQFEDEGTQFLRGILTLLNTKNYAIYVLFFDETYEA